MSKILAFAGSNSSTSINHSWLTYIKTNHLASMELLNLSAMDIPIYDMDTEKESGYPETIVALANQIAAADFIVISSSEHNGSYTSFLKTVLDWLSRNNRDFIRDKKVLITGTSPGRGGAASSIAATKTLIERLGGVVLATMSLPSWEYAFENEQLLPENEQNLNEFLKHLN